MNADVTSRAIHEAQRRWWKNDKVVPIERGFAYRTHRDPVIPPVRPQPPSDGPRVA